MRPAHPFPTLPRLRVCQRQVPPQLQAVSPPGSRTHHPNQSPTAASWPAFRERRFRPLSLCSPHPHPAPEVYHSPGFGGSRLAGGELSMNPHTPRLRRDLAKNFSHRRQRQPLTELLPNSFPKPPARTHTDTRTPSRRLPAPGAQRSPDPRVPVT